MLHQSKELLTSTVQYYIIFNMESYSKYSKSKERQNKTIQCTCWYQAYSFSHCRDI